MVSEPATQPQGPVVASAGPLEPVAGDPLGPSEGGRVKLILEDGTLAAPALDDELAERLRYIVDNIVTPPEQPST